MNFSSDFRNKNTSHSVLYRNRHEERLTASKMLNADCCTSWKICKWAQRPSAYAKCVKFM